jgi:hypothetical protein
MSFQLSAFSDQPYPAFGDLLSTTGLAWLKADR